MSENAQALFDLTRTLGVLVGLVLLLVALAQRLIAGVQYDHLARTIIRPKPVRGDAVRNRMRELRKPGSTQVDRAKLDELLELVRLRREGLRA